jgi:hypothetical protein
VPKLQKITEMQNPEKRAVDEIFDLEPAGHQSLEISPRIQGKCPWIC